MQGCSFEKLSRTCSVDEGEIVRYFRMSIQVFRELLAAEVISPHLKERIKNVLKKINRDVVDAEKQLRQEM